MLDQMARSVIFHHENAGKFYSLLQIVFVRFAIAHQKRFVDQGPLCVPFRFWPQSLLLSSSNLNGLRLIPNRYATIKLAVQHFSDGRWSPTMTASARGETWS